MEKLSKPTKKRTGEKRKKKKETTMEKGKGVTTIKKAGEKRGKKSEGF